jgi:hypothetical protein
MRDAADGTMHPKSEQERFVLQVESTCSVGSEVCESGGIEPRS